MDISILSNFISGKASCPGFQVVFSLSNMRLTLGGMLPHLLYT